MTIEQLTTVIEALSVLLVGCVLLRMIQVQRLDHFRQQMFSLRDELFDFAMDGGISFEDPAYVLLRAQMNAFIRYGHHLTVFRLVMTFVAGEISGTINRRPWNEQWKEAVDNVSREQTQAVLQDFHLRSTMTAAKYILVGSPVLWVSVVIASCLIVPTTAWRGARQLVKAGTQKIFAGPLDTSLIEEEALMLS